MRKTWFWLAAIVVFLGFVIAATPAIQVIGRATLPKGISLQGVSGTIWEGRALRMIANNMVIDEVKWTINPWALLIGRVSLHLEGGDGRNADEVSIKGPLSVSLFNFNYLQSQDLLIFLPADPVIAQANLPIRVNMSGRFRLRFESLTVNPACNELTGWGDWLDASIVLPEGQAQLGNFTATLGCEGEQFAMQVNEPNALGLSFKALIQPSFKGFNVEGQFKPDPSLPRAIHSAGQFFGTPDSDGYTRFSL